MDIYEVMTTVVVFVLFGLVWYLNRERKRLKMQVYRLETDLQKKVKQ